MGGAMPPNDASNPFYDKNLGKAYDRFNSQFCHSKRLQEIMETDRTVRSRMSSCSSRSGIVPATEKLIKTYKKNHKNHIKF